ncbi:hypothetical protein C4577_06315 [Candidatus Parcubacteria bacterium]|nr:MAG: hypothetical protein C4577_06315 [Candidatus Parcubacteria bacterium]
MTGRERLLCILQGEIPDRVPVSFLVQEAFLSYFYPEKHEVDRVKDAVECAKEFGFEVMTRGREVETPYFLKKSYPNWEVNLERKIADGNLYQIAEVSTPKGILREVKGSAYDPRLGSGVHLMTTEYLIKDEKDLEIFYTYLPQIDSDTIKEIRSYASYTKKVVGETGISAPWGWAGVFNQAATYRKMEDLLMDAYLDRDFYERFMNILTEKQILYNKVLADTEYDCIGIGGNIANSSIVGKEFFNEFILPYEKRLISSIKDTGKYTLYHNCGNAKVLQQSYVHMGIDIWENIAKPPRGDNCLKETKELIGDKIILMGNIDLVDFLRKSSPDEVAKEVAQIIAVGKPGGKFIFSGNDCLEPDTPAENIKKAVEVAVREGKY